MRIMNRDPRLVTVRWFACSVCGTTAPATKRKQGARTVRRGPSAGHVKDMWCHCCMEETAHVQVE